MTKLAAKVKKIPAIKKHASIVKALKKFSIKSPMSKDKY